MARLGYAAETHRKSGVEIAEQNIDYDRPRQSFGKQYITDTERVLAADQTVRVSTRCMKRLLDADTRFDRRGGDGTVAKPDRAR
jgi:hypothetical protein